jgi:hypothetical protein
MQQHLEALETLVPPWKDGQELFIIKHRVSIVWETRQNSIQNALSSASPSNLYAAAEILLSYNFISLFYVIY